MYALLILEQNSSHCITVLLTSTGYFCFLPAMKRFTMLSVLCINSLTWLRTVTQCDCCRIQLPCLSGDWNHEGTQFRTRTKRFFRVDANNFKVPLQTFCRGCWISSQRRLTRQHSRAGSQTREWVAVKVSSALVWREALVWASCEGGRPSSTNSERGAALSIPASVSTAEYYRATRTFQISLKGPLIAPSCPYFTQVYIML